MINVIMVVGRVGKDPELTYANNGTALVKFSLATDDGFGESKTTTWHNVVAFAKAAEAVAKYVQKGAVVGVVGRQQHREYEKDGVKRYFAEINASQVQFISGTRGAADDLPARDVNEDIGADDLPF